MSKIKKQYICTNCGNSSLKWAGQCFDCGLWGGIEEEIISQIQVKLGNKQEIQKLDGVVVDSLRIPTPIKELNRVLGGGLVCSSDLSTVFRTVCLGTFLHFLVLYRAIIYGQRHLLVIYV